MARRRTRAPSSAPAARRAPRAPPASRARHGAELDLDVAGVELREVQDIVDEPQQMPFAPLNARDGVTLTATRCVAGDRPARLSARSGRHLLIDEDRLSTLDGGSAERRESRRRGNFR